MFNLNKLVAGTSVALAAMTAATAFGMTDAEELASAVEWGYENELTSYSTVDTFMPYNTLTREQGAKFFSAFATLNLCKEPDETAECDFSDLDMADETLADYAVLACQLGLFKGSNGKFMPKAPFMKNEVVTVLMRALDGMQDEEVSPWWKNYFMAAKEAGITTEATAEGLARPVTRGDAIRLMYRAKSDECDATADDLQDILDNLFGPVDETDTTSGSTTSGSTTPAPVAPVSNGTLKCMLSSDTPAGATVPAGVSVKVATYECEASTEAVTLDSLVLARQGISDNNSVSNVSVFANDELVSKNKSFNSDATSSISLSPKVTVAAGAKVKLSVVAKLGVGSVTNNQRVKVAMTDFMSNGTNDKSALPAVGNQFEIVNVTPATVEVKSVGGIANVRLGQKGVKVAKFEIKNNSADNVDVTVNQITMRDLKSNVDDNLANVVLKNRGNSVATIADPMSKSLTFSLATPVVIKKGQTETFDVYADAVDGAGEQIDLVINNEVYVLGSDSRYGYGIAVNGTSSYSSQLFTITAGKVTLTKLSNPSRLAREDKDDLVLANVQLTSNESKNLTLEDIKFVANTGVSNSSYFENVELKVMNGNSYSTYSLDAMAGNAYGDVDLSISLPASGSITLQLIADVKKPLPAGYTGTSFNYSLASAGLRIIENTDDNVVTDIVPSSVTFDTMRFVAATTSLTTRSLSNVNVVKGAGNVEAVRFDLLTDEVAPVRYETIVVAGNSEFNSNRVSVVRLYRGSYPNGVLVKEESQFAGNTVTLDDVNIEVPAKSTQPMYITVDTVSITGSAIGLYVSNVTAKDAENNDTLAVSGVPAAYTRYITTTNAGTLTYAINTTDSKTNKAKVVVGGTESSEVAAFELNLTNDSALLKHIELTVSGVNFNAAVNEVMLLSSTGAVVDSHAEVIGANTVQFNNVDAALAAGTTKFYVKVAAKSIGLNKDAATEPTGPYAVKVNSVTVDWNSDGSQVAYTAGSNYSKDFTVRAVRVSNVSLASAGSALPANTTLLTKVANVTFTADASSNTSVGGFDLKAKISALKLNFGGSIAPYLTTVELRDSAGSVVATCSVAGACTAVSPWALVDQGGSSTFYVYAATAAAPSSYGSTNTDTLSIGIANTDADISYVASDTNGVDQYGVQMGLYLPGVSSVSSVSVSE
jgi:hypothetical protein